MISCRVLVKGPYSDYQVAGTNRKARIHSPGDFVLFPVDYAKKLEATRMVEIVEDVNYDVIEIDEVDTPIVSAETPFASDSAIEFAADHSVDLKTLVDRASGADGRILLTDVRKYVSEQA